MACLSSAEERRREGERRAGKGKIVEAGSGSPLARHKARSSLMATRGSPEAPVFCEWFTGTVRYKSPTEALTVPVNAQAPFNRPKYRYTVAAGDGAPTSGSIHLLMRYQLARGQYKYLHEARCIRRLVDPLSLPLWTSVDSPATARPFFFSTLPLFLSRFHSFSFLLPTNCFL